LPFFIVKNLVVVAAIMGLCIVRLTTKVSKVLVLMGVLESFTQSLRIKRFKDAESMQWAAMKKQKIIRY
jgi:hypothetical protein